jgi:hypothetical protein
MIQACRPQHLYAAVPMRDEEKTKWIVCYKIFDYIISGFVIKSEYEVVIVKVV